MELDKNTIRKIIEELFKFYNTTRVFEAEIRRFLKINYNIVDEDDFWRILIEADRLRLITICASPYKYGEISIVKGNVRKKYKYRIL